jgi:ribosomal protein S18 acetylase RimI-like enzyme
MDYQVIHGSDGPHKVITNERIASFLFEHLDEFGDKLTDILKCLDYVFHPDKGGRIVVALENGEIKGAVVLNNTGMSGYIPENILVYIAVHRDQRGKGLGRILMQQAIDVSPGSIALHVEPDNPAVHLYRKIGFTSKYLEMRYQRES